jgi:hypothetical protein
MARLHEIDDEKFLSRLFRNLARQRRVPVTLHLDGRSFPSELSFKDTRSVVAGGPQVIVYRERVIENGMFDLAVMGPGEKILEDLLLLRRETGKKKDFLERVLRENNGSRIPTKDGALVKGAQLEPPSNQKKIQQRRNAMVSVGASQNVESAEAGRAAARVALKNMNGTTPGWALAFCGGHYNPDAVLKGLRAELGDIEIVGGSAAGTITNQLLGYSGFECAVAVIPSFIPKPVILSVGGLERGTMEAGQELGLKLRNSINENSTVLIFYDSVASSPHRYFMWVAHSSTAFIRALTEKESACWEQERWVISS